VERDAEVRVTAEVTEGYSGDHKPEDLLTQLFEYLY